LSCVTELRHPTSWAVSRSDRRSRVTGRRRIARRAEGCRHGGLEGRRIWWSCSQHIPELRGDPTRLTDNGLKGTKAKMRRRWRRWDYRSFSSARRVGEADIGTGSSGPEHAVCGAPRASKQQRGYVPFGVIAPPPLVAQHIAATGRKRDRGSQYRQQCPQRGPERRIGNSPPGELTNTAAHSALRFFARMRSTARWARFSIAGAVCRSSA